MASLAIAYRIYPGVSKVPPVHSDDKYKLSELCLKSFRDSLADIDYKIWAILDNCPPEYIDLFKKYFDKDRLEIIEEPGVGNPVTFRKQVEILLNQTHSDNCYFAEDDYFYIENTFPEMIEFLNSSDSVDFVTPYDHPDYYHHPIHKRQCETRYSRNRYWRTAPTTCMTFLTKKQVLMQAQSILLSYSKKNYDTSMWMSITKSRVFDPSFYFSAINNKFHARIAAKMWIHGTTQHLFGKKFKLWSPLPSIATHMESNYLAPTINWNKKF
jgi:hypothetical protein